MLTFKTIVLTKKSTPMLQVKKHNGKYLTAGQNTSKKALF